MEEILGLGILLSLGLVGGKISHHLGLPSVTGYILMGLLLSPSGFGIIEPRLVEKLMPINSFALSFIALTIGGELKRERFQRLGRGILKISFFECAFVFLGVTIALLFLKQNFYLGLLVGALSMATAPGPLVAIIRERRARGPLSDTLLATTAIDNLLTIILFGIILSLARFHALERGGAHLFILRAPLLQVGLSTLWGGLMALLLHVSLSMARSHGEELTLALSIPLLAAGLASSFNLSALLSLMVMGFFLANFSYLHQRIFAAFNHFMIPILIAFLTLGGVKLEIEILKKVKMAGIGAAVARILGKVTGANIGGYLSYLPPPLKGPWLGLGLTPKAGISIGLAIIGEEKLPSLEGRLLAIILFMVIIFEIIGPLLTVYTLKRAKEIE